MVHTDFVVNGLSDARSTRANNATLCGVTSVTMASIAYIVTLVFDFNIVFNLGANIKFIASFCAVF
jgi:hypothetical protein